MQSTNWFYYKTIFIWGSRWRSWLRHFATNRKVAGSIPDDVSEIFHSHCSPGVDSASNRNEYQEYFLGGKRGRCVWLTTLPPSCADCLEIWEPQPPPVRGLLYLCFTLLFLYNYNATYFNIQGYHEVETYKFCLMLATVALYISVCNGSSCVDSIILWYLMCETQRDVPCDGDAVCFLNRVLQW
jgi:hypothetical protein